jgi:spore coat protein U-like protein
MFSNSIKKCVQITLGATTLSLLVGGGLAFAQTATTNLGVSADVTNNCTIAAAPALTVGNYNVLSPTALTPTATLAVTCTAGAVATIALDPGANGVHAIGTTRAMADGMNYLSYELHSDAGLSTVWGNTVDTDVVEAAAPSTTAVDYTVYASVPAQQSVPAGTYTDSVAVTVSF